MPDLAIYKRDVELFTVLDNPTKSVSINFGCGITAGVLASAITHPADVVKTKMQLYPSEFKNALNAFYFVYNKYGVFGYFKGIVPRMLRRTLMTTMAWTVYEQVIFNFLIIFFIVLGSLICNLHFMVFFCYR